MNASVNIYLHVKKSKKYFIQYFLYILEKNLKSFTINILYLRVSASRCIRTQQQREYVKVFPFPTVR